MTTLVVTRNFQVTIPRELRKQMAITIGDKLTGIFKNNTFVLAKSKKSDLDFAFGVIKTKKSSVDIVKSMRDDWREHGF